MTPPAADTADTPAQPSVPPLLTLGFVCIAVLVGSIDLTVVTAVLPKMLSDLHVSLDTELNRAAWIITGYLLTYTVSLTFMGRLSDLLGRRTVYLVCLGIFIVGSVLVAAAGSLEGLIFGRVVQAFGAGAVVPISMALVGDLFPPARRAPALGFVGAVETVGWMIGHLYGGVLMQLFNDWRLLFWINVPLGLLALVLVWWALRPLPIRRAAGRFDWLGALLIGGCLVALNVGLSAGAELGQTDFYGERTGPPPYALPLIVAALGLLGAFIWAERRAAWPLLDLGIFRQRTAAAACGINVLMGFALALALANVPLFIHTRLELTNIGDPNVLRRGAWESGWMLSALTLTMAALSVPGGWLTNRYGVRLPTLLGLLAALAGYLLLSTWQPDTGYAVMAGELVLTGLGLGLLIAPLATAVLNAAGAEHHGSASALVITLRLIGMTIGVSVLTLWGVQRQDMLRRAAADDPFAQSDPIGFLLEVAAQVIGETFLFAVAACLLALLVVWWMRPDSSDSSPPQNLRDNT
jgi:EmrB/QacA subfamily drug resistance transporter